MSVREFSSRLNPRIAAENRKKWLAAGLKRRPEASRKASTSPQFLIARPS